MHGAKPRAKALGDQLAHARHGPQLAGEDRRPQLRAGPLGDLRLAPLAAHLR
jgi:hypothetical protein